MDDDDDDDDDQIPERVTGPKLSRNTGTSVGAVSVCQHLLTETCLKDSLKTDSFAS
jgi:hypothetical protein